MALNHNKVVAIALISIGAGLAIGFWVAILNDAKIGLATWTVGCGLIAAGVCVQCRLPAIAVVAIGIIVGIISWAGLFLYLLLTGGPPLL